MKAKIKYLAKVAISTVSVEAILGVYRKVIINPWIISAIKTDIKTATNKRMNFFIHIPPYKNLYEKLCLKDSKL